MGRLQDILYGVKLLQVAGSTQLSVSQICIDSRQVVAQSLFAAIPGTQVDGHQYIDSAIEKGATVILCEQWPASLREGITYLQVPDAAVALGVMASNYFGNPSDDMRVVAVTGTNGKTSVATLLYQLFEQMGYKCGLLSTVRNLVHETVIPATHTTPDAVSINRLMAQMAEAGCEYVFMEASSHAIHQSRMAGLTLAGAIFTNITHDHLDYHKTFDNYIKAKKKLFDDLPASAWALTNADDKRGMVMVQNTKGKVVTYGLKGAADYHARIMENGFQGLTLQVEGKDLHTRLVGDFNAYNMLAVYAAARLLGADQLETLRAISIIQPAEGRFDIIRSGDGITAIVDYAHTPDALEKVLETITLLRTGNEQVITVVGCGGDRDTAKRPKMALVAAKLSDKVILTSDNPRSEEPEAIIEQMKAGVLPPLTRKLLSIVQRKEAIHTACMLAQPGDIILVAGKGHEKYQEIKGQRLPFDDKAELLNALQSTGH